MEIKIASQKIPTVESKIASEGNFFFGGEEGLCELGKGIYETCNRSFVNLAIIFVVVVSIVQFILFLCFARIISEKPWCYDTRRSKEVKFFWPQCDLMGHPALNLKLYSKTTSYHKNLHKFNCDPVKT